MIQYFSPTQRFLQRLGWIDIYCLFSCNTYFDPNNFFFSNIIALNEYIIQPGFGFNTHPHEDVEQIFFVVEGELTHADSLGNRGVIGENTVQSISAGTGYSRYAYNLGKVPCRYIAIWLSPVFMGTKPKYSFSVLNESHQNNTAYIPLVTSTTHIDFMTGNAKTLPTNANAAIHHFISDEKTFVIENSEEKAILIYVISGHITINNETLRKGGHARISGKERIRLSGASGAEAIIISMW